LYMMLNVHAVICLRTDGSGFVGATQLCFSVRALQ